MFECVRNLCIQTSSNTCKGSFVGDKNAPNVSCKFNHIYTKFYTVHTHKYCHLISLNSFRITDETTSLYQIITYIILLILENPWWTARCRKIFLGCCTAGHFFVPSIQNAIPFAISCIIANSACVHKP